MTTTTTITKTTRSGILLVLLSSVLFLVDAGKTAADSPTTMLSKRPLSVVVVGGTHGNEYTGVWVVKSLERQLQQQQQQQNNKYTSPAFRKNINLSTMIGNPAAFMANRRFIDEDLNRQFSYSKLMGLSSEEENVLLSLEAQRARELDQLLGPKFGDSTTPPKADVIVDLHTTTGNMKTCIIIGAGDPLMANAAAYILSKCGKDQVSILLHTHKSQKERPGLSSIAPHSLSIEVGPVPQGVLRHDIVNQTQTALDAFLEFLSRNQESEDSHKELIKELQTAFPTGRIPCIRSAPSTRPGEMSSKIPWPTDDENNNPNFPLYMVHSSVQDNDFQPISIGDPLFVDLDGNEIFYDGSHGEEVLLMFINEGGYYYKSSGTGISVAKRDEFDLKTGQLIVEEEEEEESSSAEKKQSEL